MEIEVAVLGSPVPNSPYGLRGGKATLNSNWGYLWQLYDYNTADTLYLVPLLLCYCSR